MTVIIPNIPRRVFALARDGSARGAEFNGVLFGGFDG